VEPEPIDIGFNVKQYREQQWGKKKEKLIDFSGRAPEGNRQGNIIPL